MKQLKVFNFLFCSGGGAVAIDLAFRQTASENIYCLLLENSFTSIPDMAKQIIPWKGLSYLPLWFHKNKVTPVCLNISCTLSRLFGRVLGNLESIIQINVEEFLKMQLKNFLDFPSKSLLFPRYCFRNIRQMLD